MRFQFVAIATLPLIISLGLSPKAGLAVNLAELSARPNAPSSESPSLAPTQFNDNYHLGPGDTISIQIFNVPEYSGNQQVLADGSVNLPAVGRLSLMGLTLVEAENAIAQHYRNELTHPAITVTLIQPRPIRIAIAGEIQKPGMYSLTVNGGAQFPSVAQALQNAGGVTQAADLRQVQVQRRNSQGNIETLALNLWELIQNGNLSQDIALRDGDEITIPALSSINIAETAQLANSTLASNSTSAIDVALVGEIARPGAYKLGDGTGQTTVSQAIQLAGGIRPLANLQGIQVRRLTRQGNEQVIALDLLKLVQEGDLSQDLILQQGDTIFIPTAASITPADATQLATINLSPATISVNVIGEVEQPGTIQLPPNTSLSQAILAAGGFNERATERVQLIRLNPNGTVSQQELSLDLTQGLNAVSNPMLLQNDVIVVNPNGQAAFADQLSAILGPFLRILNPFRAIF
jgi:polysaccharide biosynthesis/export protein